MNTTNEYPHAYAKGYYQGAFKSLAYTFTIPGVEIKDREQFQNWVDSEITRIETEVERFRINGTAL